MAEHEENINFDFKIEDNFSIPDNYFNDFETRLSAKIAELEEETKDIESAPLHPKKKFNFIPIAWASSSVAAAAIGLLFGIFVFNKDNSDAQIQNNGTGIQAVNESSFNYYDEIVDYYDAMQIEEYLAITEYPDLK